MNRNVNCAVFKEPRAFIKILEIVSRLGLFSLYTEYTWQQNLLHICMGSVVYAIYHRVESQSVGSNMHRVTV